MTTETMVIKLLDFSSHYKHVKMPSTLCSKLHFTTSFYGSSCSLPAAEEREFTGLRGFQFSALRWTTLSKQLNSRVSCLKLETPTPEILKMAFTFVFSICVCTQDACAHSGQRLAWGIFCSLPYCFTIINLFSDNFIHINNAFWSYPFSPLLTPCYLHLLSSSPHQVSVSLSYLLATRWA